MVAVLAAAAATVAFAQSAPQHTLSFDIGAKPLKLSRPGKPVGLTLRLRMSLEEITAARVMQVDRMTFYLPASKVNPDAFPHCTKEILRQQGPTGCPPRSQIGKGTATGDATPLISRAYADVFIFNGPRVEGKPTVLAWGKARGVQVSATVVSTLTRTSGRYGIRVDTVIPAIPTVIGQPDATVDGFDVQVGASIRKRGKLIHFAEAPVGCKPGGFHFRLRLDLSYHEITGAEPGDTFPGYPATGNPKDTVEDDAMIDCPSY